MISIIYNQYLTVWRLQNVNPVCENSHMCNPSSGYILPKTFDCREQPCKIVGTNLFSYQIKNCKLECTTFFGCEYKYTPYDSHPIVNKPDQTFWSKFIYSLSH